MYCCTFVEASWPQQTLALGDALSHRNSCSHTARDSQTSSYGGRQSTSTRCPGTHQLYIQQTAQQGARQQGQRVCTRLTMRLQVCAFPEHAATTLVFAEARRCSAKALRFRQCCAVIATESSMPSGALACRACQLYMYRIERIRSKPCTLAQCLVHRSTSPSASNSAHLAAGNARVVRGVVARYFVYSGGLRSLLHLCRC